MFAGGKLESVSGLLCMCRGTFPASFSRLAGPRVGRGWTCVCSSALGVVLARLGWGGDWGWLGVVKVCGVFSHSIRKKEVGVMPGSWAVQLGVYIVSSFGSTVA
jgi:hypothetical protein